MWDERCNASLVCNGVFWAELVAADRPVIMWLRGARPMFGFAHIWVSKWSVDLFLTFINDVCGAG